MVNLVKYKKVYLDPKDIRKTKVPISKKGDKITKNWSARYVRYKGKDRWILIRKKDGKTQRRVMKDKRYSERITREELLAAHRKRSEHAKNIDQALNVRPSNDYEGDRYPEFGYRKSHIKNLNRMDFGSKFRDKPNATEYVKRNYPDAIKFFEKTTNKKAIWNKKLTKKFRKFLTDVDEYQFKTGKKAIWNDKLTKGFKKFLKKKQK